MKIVKNLASLSIVQLTAAYNAVAERQIKKFSDKPTAEKRVEMALERASMAIVDAEGTALTGTRAQIGEALFVMDASDARLARKAEVDATRSAPPAPRTDFEDHMVITVLAEANPKREGGKAHARFALYRSGMTVAEYKEACVSLEGRGARAPFRYLPDLYWDTDHGYVVVTQPGQEPKK